MSATSGGVSGGGGSVSENSDAGESSQSTMSIKDSPSTSFQAVHGNENVTSITLTEEISGGHHAGEMVGSKINLTMDGKDQNDGVVNMGFDYEEGSKTGEGEFASINGSSKKDKVPEAVNLELVNMVPYSNGNGTSYGVPINGIPTKKDSETVDMSSPYDEYFVPVNEHKKYMRGEKLYVTKDKRRPTSWRRCLSWVIACIVIAAVLIVAILAGTGVIMSQEQNMVKEASVGRNFAGANLKPLVTEESSSKTPMPKMTEPWPSPSTDMTYLYVPKTIESELIVDNLSLDPALLNQNSTEYQEFVAMMERYLKMILFNKEILDFGESQVGLNIVNISQDPFKLIYRIGWQNKEGSNSQKDPIEMENVKKRLLESLTANQGYIDKYHIDMEGIKVGHVINKCEMGNNGCSHICYYNYLNQRFTCTCPTHLVLDSSGKNCVEWTGSAEQDYASVPEHVHHPSSHEEEISGFHHSDMGHVENGNVSGQSEPGQTEGSDADLALHHKHHETHYSHHPISDGETEPSPEPEPEPQPSPESSSESSIKSSANQGSNVDSNDFERNQGPHSHQEESTESVTQVVKGSHFDKESANEAEVTIDEHQHHIHGTNLGQGDENDRQMANSQGEHNEDSLHQGQINHDHQGHFQGDSERTDNENNRPSINAQGEYNHDSNPLHEEQIRHDHPGNSHGARVFGSGNENHPTEKPEGEQIQDSTEPGIVDGTQFNQESNPLHEGQMKHDHSGNFQGAVIGSGNDNKEPTEKKQGEPNEDSTQAGVVDKERLNQESNPLYQGEMKGDQPDHFHGANVGSENENDGQMVNRQIEQNQGLAQTGNKDISQSNQESSIVNQQQMTHDHPGHIHGVVIGSGNENNQPTGETQSGQNQDSTEPSNEDNSQFHQESSPLNQGEMKNDHHDHSLIANVGSDNENNRPTGNVQEEQNQDSHPLSEGQMTDDRSGHFHGAGVEQSNENSRSSEKTQDSVHSGVIDIAQFNQESHPLNEAEMKHDHPGHFQGAGILVGNENHEPADKTQGEQNQYSHSLHPDQMTHDHPDHFHGTGIEQNNKNGSLAGTAQEEQNQESNPSQESQMKDGHLGHFPGTVIGSNNENQDPKGKSHGEQNPDSHPLHQDQVKDYNPGDLRGAGVEPNNENGIPSEKTPGESNQEISSLHEAEMTDGHHPGHILDSNIAPGIENYKPTINAQGEQEEHRTTQDSSQPDNKDNSQFNQETNPLHEMKNDHMGHFPGAVGGSDNENQKPTGKTLSEQNQDSTQSSNEDNANFNLASNPLHQGEMGDSHHPGHVLDSNLEQGNEKYMPGVNAQGVYNQGSNQPNSKDNSQYNQESNPLHDGTMKHDHPEHFQGAHIGSGNENDRSTGKTKGKEIQDSNSLHEEMKGDQLGQFPGTVVASGNENQEPAGKTPGENQDSSQPNNENNAQFNQESSPLSEEQIKHNHPGHFHVANIGSGNENNHPTEKTQGEQNQDSTEPGIVDGAQFNQESNPLHEGQMKHDHPGNFQGAVIGSGNENNEPTEKTQGEENQNTNQPSNKNNEQVNQEFNPLNQETMNKDHPDHFQGANVGLGNVNVEATMKPEIEPTLETTTLPSTEANNAMANSEQSNKTKEHFNFNDSAGQTTSNPLDNSNVKTTFNPSVESNTEHLLHSVPHSNEILNNNNLRPPENESKNESSPAVEEPNSVNSEVKEHKVPLLEELLLRSSSLNSSVSQINLTAPAEEQNWLKNVEVNSQNQTVVEEIVVEKPDSQEKKMPEDLPENQNPSGKEDAVSTSNDSTNHPNGDLLTHGNNQNAENKNDPNAPGTLNNETESKITSPHDIIQDGGVENEVKDNSSAKPNNSQEVNKFGIVGDSGKSSDSTEKSSTEHLYIIGDHENASSLNPKTSVSEKSQEPTELSSHAADSNTSRQPVSEQGNATENRKIMLDSPQTTDPSVGSKEVNMKDQNSKEIKEGVRHSDNSESATENPSFIAPDGKSKAEVKGSEQPEGQPIQKESANHESDKPGLNGNENLNVSGSSNTEKSLDSESGITTITPKTLIIQEVTGKNFPGTEINQAPSEKTEKQNEEAQFTINYSNNIKGEGADNEEFNTLLDKDYVTKNDNGNDNKDIKANKYPNKQIFLKGDKKKLKDFVKSDKGDVDKKIIYETTKSPVTPEDFVLQKHVNGNDNDFSSPSDLQSHGEEILKPTKNVTASEIPHLDNVPDVLFQGEGIDGGDFRVLQTITPDYKTESSETDYEQDKENLKGDFKTKGTDAKEGEFKAEKDYPKFDKDYKYDKQKGGKKKDLKKKGGVKDGKNVELIEGRKYTDGLGKDENTRDETSDETTSRDSSEMSTNSLPESVTSRTISENTDSPAVDTRKSSNEAEVTEIPKVSEVFTTSNQTESNQPTLAINRTESPAGGEPVQSFKSEEQIPAVVPSVQEHSSTETGETNKNIDNLPNDKNFSNDGFSARGNNNPHEIVVEEISGSKVKGTASEHPEGSTNPTNIEIIQPSDKSSVGVSHETIPINPVISSESDPSAKTVVENPPKSMEAVGESVQVVPAMAHEILVNKRRYEINRNNNNNINDGKGGFFGQFPSSNGSTISVTQLNNTSPGTVFDGISEVGSPNGEKFKVIQYPGQSFESHNISFGVPPPSSGFATKDILTQFDSKFLVPNQQNYNTSYHTVVVQGPREGSFDRQGVEFGNNSFTYFTGNSAIPSGWRQNITYVGSDPRFIFGNHSYFFQNGTLRHPSITIGGRGNGVRYVFNGSSIVNGSEFTSFLDSLFPSDKTFKNSTIYRIENSSLPGTVFDGHFTPQDGRYHMFTNSSGTFVYTNDTSHPTFAIQGQSGDFGNSTIYLLKNIAAPPKSGVIFKNATKYTIGNITTSRTFFIPKNVTSSIISNNSSPFLSFTPTSFSSGTAYQVNDYFGYISKCASGQFQCINGTSKKGSPCINLSSKCDSINDCSDGSDEIGCIENGCPGNFQCSDGTCLKRHLVCNGITDCNDGSDETHCDTRECEFDELRCSTGRCIPIVWHCDGKPDCDNHTDEINCPLSCGNDEFMCPEGWCIPLTYKCNGIKECAEGEDEQLCDCSHEEFKCEAGGCVSKNLVCNGIDDCPDRSDEWNCFKLEENSTRLMIRSLSGEYQPVCSDNWSVERSNEVCSSMGYFSSVPQEDENTSTISTEKSFYVLKNDTTEVYNNNFLNNLVQTNECSSGKLVQITCQEFSCGSLSMTVGSNYEPRLIGGMTASAGQWPSVALLHNVRNFLSCTANILTPRWVLASYNCLKGNSKNVNQQDWKLFSGSDVFETEKEGKENRQIKKIVPHPQIKFNQFLFSNDIALLELDQPLQFSSTVGAVCLPQEEIVPRQICVTAGWGIDNPTDKKIKQQLQYLPVPTMNLQECNSTEHYSGFITDDKICAGYNDAEKSLCYNDEGAPLMCVNDRGEWEVQGVLSYHSNCGRGSHPSIFSSIMPVKKWIKETIGNRFERKIMATKR